MGGFEMMSDARYNELRQRLEESLSRLRLGTCHILKADDLSVSPQQIMKSLSASEVPALGEKGSPSSAMFPVLSNLWCIGSFGSVWLDAEIDGVPCRVEFAPQERAFYVVGIE